MTDAHVAAEQPSYSTPDPQKPGVLDLMHLSMHWGIATLSVALLLSFAVWAVGIGTRDPSEVPIIRAMEGPSRVKPDDVGGARAPHQGLAVNEMQSSGQTSEPLREVTLAPEPEAVPPRPAPTAQDIQSAIETATLTETVQETTAEIVLDTPETTTVDLSLEPVPNIRGNAFSPAISLRPRARPGAQRSQVVVTDVRQAVALSSAFPTANASQNAVAVGARLIQLGAYDTEDQAQSQWNLLEITHADLLRAKAQLIQRAESGGRVFYRLRASGFHSLEESKALCSAMLARGAPCIPVTSR